MGHSLRVLVRRYNLLLNLLIGVRACRASRCERRRIGTRALIVLLHNLLSRVGVATIDLLSILMIKVVVSCSSILMKKWLTLCETLTLVIYTSMLLLLLLVSIAWTAIPTVKVVLLMISSIVSIELLLMAILAIPSRLELLLLLEVSLLNLPLTLIILGTCLALLATLVFAKFWGSNAHLPKVINRVCTCL